MTATINDGLLQTTTVGGETSIDFDFPIYTTADLEVIRTRGGVDTTLVLTTDYTIAASELNDPTGGVITLTSAAVAGDIYTCRSNIQEARSADFQQGGDFFSATVNSELDRIIRITQQLRRDLDRAVQIAPASTISPSSLPVTMDDPVAGSLLSFSSSGGIEPVTIASLGLSGLDTVLTSLSADDGLFWNGTHWVNSKVGTSNINSGAATSGQALTANGSGGASFTTVSSVGRLIDVQTFTSSGTWTKPANTTAVEVWVVGGGGGGGGWHASSAPTAGNGNTSSFGAHCSATGGSGGEGYDTAAPTQKWANGGSGSGGTQNFNGEQGRYVSGTSYTNIGGSSLLSGQANGQESSNAGNAGLLYGGGGGGAFGSAPGCGGGGGGAAYKYITSGLGATETVTVGTGGAGGTGTYAGGAGAAGIVIVKSYS